MAFRKLGKLQVDVVADTSAFTKGMREVSDVLGTVRGGVERFAGVVGGAASAVANIAAKIGGLGAAIAGGSFVVLTTRAFKTTGALSEMSRQLGVTIADLARAKQATILAGESTKVFDSRIQKLSSQLRNAGDKAVMFKAAIQSWVADLAKGGSEADRFGLVVEDAFGRMVERANIAARRLREAFVGRFRQIAIALAPFVEFAANKLTEFVTAGTTDFGLVDKGMRVLRDTIGTVVGLLDQGTRTWLEFKVGALEALVAIEPAVRFLAKAFNVLKDAVKGPPGGITIDEPEGTPLSPEMAAWARGFLPENEVRAFDRLNRVDDSLRKLSTASQGSMRIKIEPEVDTGDFAGNLKKTLQESLEAARKQLEDWKPRGLEPRFLTWFDDIIQAAKDNMDEFARVMDPPDLKDFKLPQIGGGLAPSLATGSAAAAQARFQATTQVGGAEASLRELVSIAMLQQGGDDRRTGLLDDIRRALENKTVITMGT